ncbi:MAG: TOBE domain-containing protein, partial [Pseudomonadota bacterium]
GSFDLGQQMPISLVAARFDRVETDYGMTLLSLGKQRLTVSETLTESEDPYRLRINASDVAVALHRPVGTSFQNVLEGHVLDVQRLTAGFADVVVSVDGQPVVARVTRKAADELKLAVDMTVFVLIKSMAIEGAVCS